ncbi:SDR family oxidoreductase [Methylophaga sulfidovorans]|uniref:Short-chain dehydrogenase n=1 Tax=Methylophaga sulfidovorans TaxID=45496 RepID=A0A1I4B8N6_9GAMM|nr:SDR family oxidoreductase [Methylophaga sulfidovorans]SFK64286.1 Short-chain dehydrogenase [Methylophaga sulfidovorans]
MTYTVENKVALITGANRGIGKAIVESFIEHGAKKVYLAVRNPDSTKELEDKYGEKVTTLRADVSDAQSIQQLAEQASDVDIVVNNAGIMKFASPLSDDVEEVLTSELDINAFGLLRVAKAFANTLEANQGALVQLNSIASIKTFADISTYCASKAASYALTQGLRDKFGEKGVRVLSVHPGPIATDMGAEAGFDGAPAATEVSEGIIKALESGDFHLFPDVLAKQFEAEYQNFADKIVNASLSV